MSRTKFEDDCPGCRPAMINPATGKVYPDDSPIMVATMKVWGETTREEREAFHRVTCLNSRDPRDLNVMRNIIARLQAMEPE